MSENQNIEWKETWRDEYLKWICGFANAKGGTIYIGKNNIGDVVGVTNSQKLMQDIPNKVKDILGIIVDVNLYETKEGDYIEIAVDPQPFPVNYKGQYHYRSGSTKQELKGLALDKFLLQRNGKRWDSVPVPNVAIEDLKQETFDLFRSQALNSQRIEKENINDSNSILLENLLLIENDYLKRSAILLFHPNPEKFVTGAYIKIGYFQSDDDLKYQDEIHGNLFDQIEKASDLLFTKYMIAEISYEGLNRLEKFEYAKEAIREALLNAVCHKDYSGGTPIQISVYQEKIIFWNEGQLPENWTIENLLVKHPSKPYNPDIANALFRSGYIESWGRGTLKMINECIKAGFPKPNYYYDMSGFWVEFRKDIFDQSYLKRIGLNDRQINAMHYVKLHGKITNRNYQQINNISKRTASYDLTELVENYHTLIKIGNSGAGVSYETISKMGQ
ncbi:MAG: ATP-binding protein [Paludibacter sp.]|nr:ATP-binding protein [Paludibacter sp.]